MKGNAQHFKRESTFRAIVLLSRENISPGYLRLSGVVFDRYFTRHQKKKRSLYF